MKTLCGSYRDGGIRWNAMVFNALRRTYLRSGDSTLSGLVLDSERITAKPQ